MISVGLSSYPTLNLALHFWISRKFRLFPMIIHRHYYYQKLFDWHLLLYLIAEDVYLHLPAHFQTHFRMTAVWPSVYPSFFYNFCWNLLSNPTVSPRTNTSPQGFPSKPTQSPPIQWASFECLHQQSSTLSYIYGHLFNLIFFLMSFVDDRVDLDQHLRLEVFIGGEVSSTATAPYYLDVLV